MGPPLQACFVQELYLLETVVSISKGYTIHNQVIHVTHCFSHSLSLSLCGVSEPLRSLVSGIQVSVTAVFAAVAALNFIGMYLGRTCVTGCIKKPWHHRSSLCLLQGLSLRTGSHQVAKQA